MTLEAANIAIHNNARAQANRIMNSIGMHHRTVAQLAKKGVAVSVASLLISEGILRVRRTNAQGVNVYGWTL